jgi:hypothetical protein
MDTVPDTTRDELVAEALKVVFISLTSCAKAVSEMDRQSKIRKMISMVLASTIISFSLNVVKSSNDILLMKWGFLHKIWGD